LLALIIAGVGVFYVFAIPPFLRARFSSPTVGREALIGEMGAALTEVNPEGVVEVRDARWRAITNRATPVTVGDRIRVTAVLGFVLEVEPEEGGAQDYREKRSRRKAK
jgi:membrane-bound serine protease (ClpP class)